MTERKVYTAEFKREAVRLSEQAGVSVAQVAQELGVSDYRSPVTTEETHKEITPRKTALLMACNLVYVSGIRSAP